MSWISSLNNQMWPHWTRRRLCKFFPHLRSQSRLCQNRWWYLPPCRKFKLWVRAHLVQGLITLPPFGKLKPNRKPSTPNETYTYRLGGNAPRPSMIEKAQLGNPGPGGCLTGPISKRVDKMTAAPNVRIGTAQRRPLIEGTSLTTPPPGTYEIKSKLIES